MSLNDGVGGRKTEAEAAHVCQVDITCIAARFSPTNATQARSHHDSHDHRVPFSDKL